ncbi:M13 family metallopeptidase [Novosphingobium sp. 9U]|uniref:M13 family metallopeptidase n=1 Tax=Novosphingobium sp. 9U TaxID=2653158 RepID=UPI0012EF7046|nr:M13-type metalloendopeptidase [Novosphingobium sp. 9U]VWX46649.1 Zinc metalloprotease [Novosphingobium sp. 9U]
MPLRFTSLLAAASLAALATSPCAQAQTATPAKADAAAVQPETDWGTFGVQTKYFEPSVKPGDDFNTYVNGKWLSQTEIPADRSRFGSFDILNNLSIARLHDILDGLAATKQAPGTAEERLANAYKAFTDTAAIDAKGMAPLKPYLAKIQAANTPTKLMSLFGQPGFASPIDASMDPDEKQSGIYALYLSQGDLGLPDRDYYLKNDAKSQEIRAKYLEYTTFLLGKLGYADAPGTAKAILALETQLAQAKWDRAAQRNPELTYNKLSRAEAEALATPGEMNAFFQALGVSPQYVVVSQMPPTADELKTAGIDAAKAQALFGGGVPATAKLVNSAPIATWQAWLATRFVAAHASYLPKEIDDANFAFYGKVLSGQPEQRPRWKRGISAVEGQIGELLGRIYAAKYYPPAQKAAMADLVGNLRKAMAANLQDLAWMGPATRKEAEAKLDAFTTKIGAPDEWKTYEGLTISPTDALGNAINAEAWKQQDQMRRLGKPVDRKEWLMLPETVNAYYNPPLNEIVFPAAILQPPFFNLSADPAVNYGAIGGVIGHEMGHGFDDQGSKYDGTGNLRDWWTAQDQANFQKLQDKLAAQYDALCPYDEGKTCVNGKLTMGENIGDLGGLSLAYRAYKLSLNGKPDKVIGGMTGDQRFFLGWAQVWRSKIREAQGRQYLIVDPHSPDQYRINGIVRNFDEWYKAFNVKPGDKLYLPPEQRVRIW